MAMVIFMRGANVGGRKTFRPSVLAKELAAFDVKNVGAAGTFVVGKRVSQAMLRAELLRRLPFEVELMICRGSDLLELATADPFPPEASGEGVRRFLTVMARRPRKMPRLPINEPASGKWQVKVVKVKGRFALSLWRRMGRGMVYPNEVVEKVLGVSATTRNWSTISTICKILRAG